MEEPIQPSLTTEAVEQLRQLYTSTLDFRTMVAALPPEQRSPEHSQQFNQLRREARTLMGINLREEVPRAITGNYEKDRQLSLVVIGGVILALLGLGINSIVLEDVYINSAGCCISSGGMLLVVGALVVLLRNMRGRASTMSELQQRCDLLLHQIDHHLRMVGVDISREFQ
jgi:hypothetical protein